MSESKLTSFLSTSIRDASANAQSFLQAANYSAMLELLLGTLPTTDPEIIGKRGGLIRADL